MVQIARGTPHGRDRERWGFTRDGHGGRRLSPERHDYNSRHEQRGPYSGGGSKRASWLEKYGPPERTEYRDEEEEEEQSMREVRFHNQNLSSQHHFLIFDKLSHGDFHYFKF